MGLLRKRKNAEGRDDTTDTMATPIDEELNGQVQEVMKDNLELMRDVVMRIREEPEFAKGIYKDCPRLQHLLDQYPDLRPIFEDPKLVRINFEQVYRDAGGVLPEDEEKAKKKSCLVWFVNSPIFKVLKLLLFVKKLMACIAGGGFAFLTGCLVGCCFEDALEELDGDADDADGDADMEEGQIDPSKEALNRAADHMEDPDVQEHMQQLLDDPEGLDEAIENDSELRALRDSNPLCEELMSDPDTMKILTDPDNLRALGEAPDLIEADFIDPEGFTPTDIETGGGFDGGMDGGFDGGMDQDFDIDIEADDDGFDNNDDFEAEGEEEEGEEEEEWWDDAELEEQDGPDNDQGGAKGGQKGNAKAQPKQQAKQAQQQQGAADGAKQGRFGAIMATIGVAATELIASQLVGSVMGDGLIPGGMGGGGGDLDVDGGDDIGDAMDDAGINDIADDAGEVINDDVADVAEDTMDEVDDKADDAKDGNNASAADIDPDAPDTDKDGKDGKNGAAIAGGVAGGAMVAGAAGVALSRSKDRKAVGEDGEELEEGEDTFADEEEVAAPKKSKLGWIKGMASTLVTATKEHITSNLLGDDFGEQVVEWQEDKAEDKKKEGEENDEEDDDKKEGGEEEKKKKRGMFGRKKKD
jgi:hypothetical protein